MAAALPGVTVDYCELHGSYKPQIGLQDASDERQFVIAWEDKEQFVREVLGGTTVVGEIQTYNPPSRHPKIPQIYAINTRVSGQGLRGVDADGIIAYEKAFITVDYGTIDDQSGSDSPENRVVYISESRVVSYEHQQLKTKNLYWLKTPITFYDLLTTGGRIPDNHVRGTSRIREHTISVDDIDFTTPIDAEITPRIVLPKMELDIDIHWWYNYPDDDYGIMQLLGCVNYDYYKPLLTTYPPQTLLFAGAERKRQYTNDGITAWQITYKFLLNKFGWNTSLREEKWKTVTEVIPGNPGIPAVVKKTKVIDTDWPLGFYPIATSSADDEIIWPYQLANFTTNLMPSGFRARDFGPEITP